MRRILAAAVLASTATLAGCASTPPPVSEKVQAYYEANSTMAPSTQQNLPLTLAEVLPKLQGQEEFVLTVLGDSTGVGPQAWVHQTVQRVASASGRPAVLRDWNPEAGAYGEPVRFGPAGEPTLIVWNGSASGKNAAYAAENLAALLPQKSDLVFINHGHNTPALMNAMEQLKRLILGVWSTESYRAAVVVTAQNPRTDEGAAVDAEVVAATRNLPAEYPTLSVNDIYGAFEATGDAPSLLADGLHPTPAGHQVWTEATVKLLGF